MSLGCHSGCVVVHRMQCADITPDNATGGHWVYAKADFVNTLNGTVKLVRIYIGGKKTLLLNILVFTVNKREEC